MRKKLILLAVMFLCVSPLWAGSPKPAPFILWPASPEATPEPYVKAAPPLPMEGKKWPVLVVPKGQEPLDVKVDLSKTLAPVTPYNFGGNVAWWDHHDWFLSEDIIEKARQSGIRFWRWPGGSSADSFHWDGDYKGHEKGADGKDRTNMNKEWASPPTTSSNSVRRRIPKRSSRPTMVWRATKA